MPITIIDRFHPKQRDTLQSAAEAGHFRMTDEVVLLEPKQLRVLAILSLQLFAIGGIFFIVLNLLAYIWRTGQHGAALNPGQVVLWLLINLAGYFLILPIHELLHGIAFIFWGGKPYYGTKLPLALFCSAKNQLFPRNYYFVIGLAPLVVITLAGIIFTLFAPALAPYSLFAMLSNISGASGDLWVVQRLRSVPASAFVEDRETGYRVWEVELTPKNGTIPSASVQSEKE